MNIIVRLAANLGHRSSFSLGRRLARSKTIGSCSALLSKGVHQLRRRLDGSHVLALRDRQIGIETEDLLELVHAVDLGAHRDVGDAFEDELEHDGNLMLLP